jgi:hypothetical protein
MQLSQGHDRQSLSPAGLTRWYRLCAARVFHRDCHECVLEYAAHPPVSTPIFPVTATLRGYQGHHRPAWRQDGWSRLALSVATEGASVDTAFFSHGRPCFTDGRNPPVYQERCHGGHPIAWSTRKTSVFLVPPHTRVFPRP